MGPFCAPVRMALTWAVPVGLTRSPAEMPRTAERAVVGRPEAAEAWASTTEAGWRYGTRGTSGMLAMTRCAEVMVGSSVMRAWYCVVKVASGGMLEGLSAMS